jgi:signal transduction histidine kinase
MARKRDDRRSPERAKTDKSLREERANTDDAITGEGAPAAASGHEGRADALEKLLVHERAATDAYLLTERVRSDKDVAHRDDFLGMVTHDVRNLLNLVVLTLATLPPDDQGSTPQVTAAAHRIRRYVARMSRLIGDLVDITSIDKGKLAVEPVEGDAAALLAEATDAFQSAALEQGVTLSAEIPAGPLRAVFDHDRVLQVFANLLSNAIKFTPRGGRIGVGVREVRGVLEFCVRDTGVGIPAPMRERIFERFWQAGENDRRGMGLGLYISKCIVESHGGRIWAKGTVGKGTELYVTIPVTESRPRRSTARSAGPDKARPKRRAQTRALRPRRKQG